MPTLREVITDILANPAAYTDAFPVSEPEVVEHPALNPPSVGMVGTITPEMFDEAVRRLREPVGDVGPHPGPPPITATGVQIQEQNQRYIRLYEDSLRARYSAYGRPPAGLPVYIDRDASPNEMRVYEGDRQVGSVVNLGPPVEVPESMWEFPTRFVASPVDHEPAPSTDRFYLDADGELQFGPR